MRIKYGLICLLFFSFLKIFAQEDPAMVLFPWMNPFYNPGAMGEQGSHINFLGVLNQYSMMAREDLDENLNIDNPDNHEDPNYPGSGTQFGGGNNNNNKNKNKGTKVDGQQVVIHIDSYIKQIKGAVGIVFIKDKNAYYDNIEFRLGYATRFRVRGGNLGIGIQLGFLNQKIGKDLRPIQGGDPTVNAATSGSVMDFDMNVGLQYKAPTWNVGVSCSKILGGVRISGETGVMKLPQQFYFMGGYIWNLKTAVPWSIEPSVMIRTNFATWRIGVLAAARYNGILWFGAAYGLDNDLSLFVGAVPFYNHSSEYLKRLELGVAYSFPLGKNGFKKNGSMGDFQILVRYGFNFYKEKALTGYGSSRHLYKNQY
jgi:type IX secretion system PorP/SprF family membrane protein